jgi:exopolysaccharide biosynthesis polyprenyl glycosylphosphotransferase
MRPAQAGVASRRSGHLRMALLAARISADGLLLLLAFVMAYWLRYGLEFGREVSAVESRLPLSAFQVYLLVYVLGALFIMRMRGLYALPRGASWPDHMAIITSSSFISVSALTLGILFFQHTLPSRLVFIYVWLCTVLLFGVERFLYRRARIWLWQRGVNVRRAIVVGTSLAGQRIIKDIVERPELGYRLVGYLSDGVDTSTPRSPGWRVPLSRRKMAVVRLLGSTRDVERVLMEHQPHEVIVALPATHHAQTLAILAMCRDHGIDFKLVPDLFEMRFNEVRIDALNGVPLIGVKDIALQGFNLFLKRALDLTVGVVALVVAALPMLAVAVAVKLTSPGPVLFRQKRVGKDGKLFTCYKFRSMYQDAEARLEELRHLNEADGPIFKIRNDPRLTPVGRFIRRCSLDELPQIFNILKGEMSWVGPRPPTPKEVTQYDDWHLRRLNVMPGLTGLWQVSGRSDLSFEEMVKLDLYYAENWSLGVDLKIMLRTIPAVLGRSGAY